MFKEIHTSVQMPKQHKSQTTMGICLISNPSVQPTLRLSVASENPQHQSIQSSLAAPLSIANENPPPQSFYEQILPVPVHISNEIT